MRLAARSNWLWAMALPDIGARAGAVTNDLRGSGAGSDGMQAPAGRPGRRMLDFGHRLHGVGHPLTADACVSEHAADVGLWRPRLRGMLQDEHEAAAVLLDGPHGLLPRRVGGQRAQRYDERCGPGIEPR